MTKEQLDRGVQLSDQKRYLDRLFDKMENDVDFNCNLDDSYRIILTVAFIEVKNQIKEEFEEL